jgi:hypothetical protein
MSDDEAMRNFGHEVRETLDEAILRAFVEPVRIVDGEDPAVVNSLLSAALLHDPQGTRRVALVQRAAWHVVEHYMKLDVRTNRSNQRFKELRERSNTHER